jgi:hypothetical protein
MWKAKNKSLFTLQLLPVQIRMRHSRLLTALFAIALLTGCSSNNPIDKLKFFNDMETLATFTRTVPAGIVYSESAYSGNYICMLDSTNVFSPSFSMQVKKISAKPVQKVTISAWIKIEPGADPNLTLDVMNDKESTIEWITKSQQQELKPGKWMWVGMTIDLRAKGRNNPENIFKIYAFNKASSKAYIDNMEIQFEQ